MTKGVGKGNLEKGTVFLDLFSPGKTSPVGRQVGEGGGAFISFDVLVDMWFDLGNPEVEGVVKEFYVQEEEYVEVDTAIIEIELAEPK